MYLVPLPRVTSRFAGRMVMSLCSMKGVPPRMSTSRLETTSPSKNSGWFSRRKDKFVSPTMSKGLTNLPGGQIENFY